MSTWWMDCKNIKKKISQWLFEIIHIIRFEIWDLRSRDLKKFYGYDINYLSIWPFMGDDHVTVFRLVGDVIHQQAENR